jgi:hypothetical protein
VYGTGLDNTGTIERAAFLDAFMASSLDIDLFDLTALAHALEDEGDDASGFDLPPPLERTVVTTHALSPWHSHPPLFCVLAAVALI